LSPIAPIEPLAEPRDDLAHQPVRVVDVAVVALGATSPWPGPRLGERVVALLAVDRRDELLDLPGEVMPLAERVPRAPVRRVELRGDPGSLASTSSGETPFSTRNAQVRIHWR
jgi:hypothetical protein